MCRPSEHHISTAVKSANDAALSQFKHGCIIFNKKKVISTGFNKPRFIPRLAAYHYPGLSLHAEADAILKARREDLKRSTLLVIRLGRSKLCNSKPCEHCMSLIDAVGIKHVYYSDRDGYIRRLY